MLKGEWGLGLLIEVIKDEYMLNIKGYLYVIGYVCYVIFGNKGIENI